MGALTLKQLQHAARTLAKPIEITGFGLHTGQSCRLHLAPAPPGWWFRSRCGEFQRVEDLRLVGDQGATTLETLDGARYATVEHLLAALSGLAIDGVRISLEGAREIPALDGSAIGFVRAIRAAETRLLHTPAERWTLSQAFCAQIGASHLCLQPSKTLKLSLSLDLSRWDGPTSNTSWCQDRDPFDALALARTFAFLPTLTSLKRMGLARGGSLCNAIALDGGSVLNPGGLRVPDELAKHKALDLLGDLGRLGRPIIADIDARDPNHRLNQKAVSNLLKWRTTYA